jgi:hypothetical protein
MEINFEMSPLSEKGSDSMSVPYSRMTEEEAQVAFSTRKEQIRAMLKSRRSLQTPDSSSSKCSVASNRSKQSTQTKPPPSRFTAGPEKVAKHGIDLPLESQQQLKERLKGFVGEPEEPINKKYDVSEPLYKRTVEWKQNLKKNSQEEKKVKEEMALEECTFEPSLEKTEIRNLSVGVYERQVMWKNAMVRRNEKIRDLNTLKEIEECTFQPEFVSKPHEFTEDFQGRNQIWQERLIKKSKKIEEENYKEHVFYPKVNKSIRKNKTVEGFEGRFEMFLEKLDEISDKIDSTLANAVL